MKIRESNFMEKDGKKTIIGFDLDGVIIDHADLKIKMAEKFGQKLKMEQTSSEIMKSVISDGVYREIQHFLYEHPTEAIKQPLMAGAKENLQKVRESSLPYYLISRRHSKEGRKNAVELLKIHKLWPDCFNEKNVFFVVLPEDKNIKAKELGITHYVDDERKVLEKLLDVENKFLFDPFGAVETPAGCTAIRSWDELPPHFCCE